MTGTFLMRWKWLENLVFEWHLLTGMYPPFRLQRWLELSSKELPSMIMNVKEGLVVQSLIAGPGTMSMHLGSAKYVKREPTIDIVFNNEIWEFTLDNKPVRARPDKKKPNDAYTIQSVKDGLKFETFVLCVMSVVFGVPWADWNVLVLNIVNERPLSSWSIGDKLLFYYNMHSPIMRCLNKSFVEGMKAQMQSWIITTTAMVSDSFKIEPLFSSYDEGVSASDVLFEPVKIDKPTFHVPGVLDLDVVEAVYSARIMSGPMDQLEWEGEEGRANALGLLVRNGIIKPDLFKWSFV
jgi:hypothetical protein